MKYYHTPFFYYFKISNVLEGFNHLVCLGRHHKEITEKDTQENDNFNAIWI